MLEPEVAPNNVAVRFKNIIIILNRNFGMRILSVNLLF